MSNAQFSELQHPPPQWCNCIEFIFMILSSAIGLVFANLFGASLQLKAACARAVLPIISLFIAMRLWKQH
jgi:hypothetical protein